MSDGPRVLLIDNFDSFTYNLAQVLGGLGARVRVERNDASPEALLLAGATHVVVSPGPGPPERTGCAREVLERLEPGIPVLGVCLGMQLMAIMAGATVRRAGPVHGRATSMLHDGSGILQGIASPAPAGRYHSLAVDATTLPATWRPVAWSDGVLMAMESSVRPWWGVQFHPESVLTPDGPRMLANFLARRDLPREEPPASR